MTYSALRYSAYGSWTRSIAGETWDKPCTYTGPCPKEGQQPSSSAMAAGNSMTRPMEVALLAQFGHAEANFFVNNAVQSSTRRFFICFALGSITGIHK